MIAAPDPATFYPLVWEIVRQVPYGVATTYGQIASMIPAPAGIAENDFARLGPKWVGEAMNAVSFPELEGRPTAVGVPWWRVINAQGGISMPANSTAAAEQRARLEAEGLHFDANEHLDLARVGWVGPAPDWRAARGLLAPKALRQPPDTPQQIALF